MKPHIQKLLEERYFLRDEAGYPTEKSVEEMFRRVAKTVASIENENLRSNWEADFFNIMVNNKFIPNTPTLINAGKDNPGSFSACFVLPVEDSMHGIYDSLKNAALIHKSGGGTGFNFSHLREEGSIVSTTGHPSSGPIEFMKVFNQSMDTVKQGGARRGASMGIMSIYHPDIEKFITMKADTSAMTNFNISVLVDRNFMEKVISDKDHIIHLISPKTKSSVKTISSKYLWNLIVEQAWKTGEPGLIFYEAMNRDNLFHDQANFSIEATNPCGELGLREYESCNLGSINLLEYVDEATRTFNYDELYDDINIMVRFLDNVIDVNTYTIEEIEAKTKFTRKIGLGIMGWADTLIKMGIHYDSDRAVRLAEEMADFIYRAANDHSVALAIEKGPYPAYSDGYMKHGAVRRRNETLCCVAPTGTISRIAGVSSGIEPIFAFETKHNIGVPYTERHWALDDISVDKSCLVTASEIRSDYHLKHQAAFQMYFDNSVSKTINLPAEATKKAVEDILVDAYLMHLKGITVYRDNSRGNQPLQKVEPSKAVDDNYNAFTFQIKGDVTPEKLSKHLDKIIKDVTTENTKKKYRKRPSIVFGPTYKVDTGKGKIYVTVNYTDEEETPVEVFVRMGHMATGTEHEFAEWSGRLISLLLKHGVSMQEITRQSSKVLGDNSFFFQGRGFRSLPQLIAHLVNNNVHEVIEEVGFDTIGSAELESEEYTYNGAYCYMCGEYAIIQEGGCNVCESCGDSKCG